VPPRRLERPA